MLPALRGGNRQVQLQENVSVELNKRWKNTTCLEVPLPTLPKSTVKV